MNFHGATKLIAVEARPFYHAVAAFLGPGEAFACIAFDVNEELEIAGILGAAPVAVAIGTLVVHDGIDGVAVLALPEAFAPVLAPVFFVDRYDVVFADPLLSLLAVYASKVACPFTAIVHDAFFAAGVRPRNVPGQVGLVPDGIGRGAGGNGTARFDGGT